MLTLKTVYLQILGMSKRTSARDLNCYYTREPRVLSDSIMQTSQLWFWSLMSLSNYCILLKPLALAFKRDGAGCGAPSIWSAGRTKGPSSKLRVHCTHSCKQRIYSWIERRSVKQNDFGSIFNEVVRHYYPLARRYTELSDWDLISQDVFTFPPSVLNIFSIERRTPTSTSSLTNSIYRMEATCN